MAWDHNESRKGVSLRQLVIPHFLLGSRRFWLNDGRSPLKMGCFQKPRGSSWCLQNLCRDVRYVCRRARQGLVPHPSLGGALDSNLRHVVERVFARRRLGERLVSCSCVLGRSRDCWPGNPPGCSRDELHEAAANSESAS